MQKETLHHFLLDPLQSLITFLQNSDARLTRFLTNFGNRALNRMSQSSLAHRSPLITVFSAVYQVRMPAGQFRRSDERAICRLDSLHA